MSKEKERETHVYTAKLAEQAERYDGNSFPSYLLRLWLVLDHKFYFFYFFSWTPCRRHNFFSFYPFSPFHCGSCCARIVCDAIVLKNLYVFFSWERRYCFHNDEFQIYLIQSFFLYHLFGFSSWSIFSAQNVL